jgi:hypothetical protein
MCGALCVDCHTMLSNPTDIEVFSLPPPEPKWVEGLPNLPRPLLTRQTAEPELSWEAISANVKPPSSREPSAPSDTEEFYDFDVDDEDFFHASINGLPDPEPLVVAGRETCLHFPHGNCQDLTLCTLSHEDPTVVNNHEGFSIGPGHQLRVQSRFPTSLEFVQGWPILVDDDSLLSFVNKHGFIGSVVEGHMRHSFVEVCKEVQTRKLLKSHILRNGSNKFNVDCNDSSFRTLAHTHNRLCDDAPWVLTIVGEQNPLNFSAFVPDSERGSLDATYVVSDSQSLTLDRLIHYLGSGNAEGYVTTMPFHGPGGVAQNRAWARDSSNGGLVKIFSPEASNPEFVKPLDWLTSKNWIVLDGGARSCTLYIKHLFSVEQRVTYHVKVVDSGPIGLENRLLQNHLFHSIDSPTKVLWSCLNPLTDERYSINLPWSSRRKEVLSKPYTKFVRRYALSAESRINIKSLSHAIEQELDSDKQFKIWRECFPALATKAIGVTNYAVMYFTQREDTDALETYHHRTKADNQRVKDILAGRDSNSSLNGLLAFMLAFCFFLWAWFKSGMSLLQIVSTIVRSIWWAYSLLSYDDGPDDDYPDTDAFRWYEAYQTAQYDKASQCYGKGPLPRLPELLSAPTCTNEKPLDPDIKLTLQANGTTLRYSPFLLDDVRVPRMTAIVPTNALLCAPTPGLRATYRALHLRNASLVPKGSDELLSLAALALTDRWQTEPLTPRPVEDWARNYSDARKRRMAEEVIQQTKDGLIPSEWYPELPHEYVWFNPLSAFVKTDETLPPGLDPCDPAKFCCVKPRIILSVSPHEQAAQQPWFMAASERFKMNLEELAEFGGRTWHFTYASGSTADSLTQWAEDALSRAYVGITSAICMGDDSVVCDPKGGITWYEFDYSHFDQSQKDAHIAAEHEVYRGLGIPDRIIARVAAMAKVPARYRSRNAKNGVKMKLVVKEMRRVTGSPNTSLGNSIVNMLALMVAGRVDFSDEGWSDAGLNCKVRLQHAEITDVTFLRGSWFDTILDNGDSLPVWLPLPSLVCKIGKVMKTGLSVDEAREYARSLAGSFSKVPSSFPILGPFVDMLTRIGETASGRMRTVAEEWAKKSREYSVSCVESSYVPVEASQNFADFMSSGFSYSDCSFSWDGIVCVEPLSDPTGLPQWMTEDSVEGPRSFANSPKPVVYRYSLDKQKALDWMCVRYSLDAADVTEVQELCKDVTDPGVFIGCRAFEEIRADY